QQSAKINEQVLGAVLATLRSLSGKVEAAPASLDGILSLKGVIEISEEDEREEDHRAAETAIIVAFEQALAELIDMRRAEGATLGRLLSTRLDEIAALTARAEKAPGRKPEAIKARLVEQVRHSSRRQSVSIPTGCIRRLSCSPPKLTSAKSSIGFPLT